MVLEGRPLTFEFVAASDTVEKVVVEDNGAIVAEGIRQDAR
jgi:hypothetical protein